MIVLEPQNGLCNRLRAIDAAYCLSKRLGMPLYIRWEERDKNELGCYFEDLFLPIPDIHFIHMPLEMPIRRWISRQLRRLPPNSWQVAYWLKLYFLMRELSLYAYGGLSITFRKLYRYLPLQGIATCARHLHLRGNFYDMHYYFHQNFIIPKIKYKRLFVSFYDPLPLHNEPLPLQDTLSRIQHLHMITCFRFYQLASPNGSHFVPVPALQRRIEKRIRDFDEHVVGVHIRRTDGNPAIRYSPTTAFEKAMLEEINTNPNTRFYLATDDPKIRSYFRKRFPKRMIVSDGALGRDSLAGMQESVVELYALAHTKKIIGSHVSSFSYEAAWLKGIPLQIAR